MTGFTLYETLRIFLPGVLFLLIADLSARLAGLPSNSTVLSTIEKGPLFLVLSVVVGLFLYAIDLPTKTRLYRGDPTRGWRLPSETLREHLVRVRGGKPESGPLSSPAVPINLYMLLADHFIPPEQHRRIYLFGSLYRVFVDLRFSLGFGLSAGPLFGLLLARSTLSSFDPFPPVSMDASAILVGTAFLLVAVGLVGIRTHARNWLFKSDATGEPRKDFTKNMLRPELGRIAWVAVSIAGLYTVAGLLLSIDSALFDLAGGVAGLGAFALWVNVELGPPPKRRDSAPGADPAGDTVSKSDKRWRDPLRHRILRWLGAEEPDVQYKPPQRIAADFALIMPSLIFASVSTANRGSPVALLAWAAMGIGAFVLMVIRKHEMRLLIAFEEQSLWIDLHRADLQQVLRRQALPSQWAQN